MIALCFSYLLFLIGLIRITLKGDPKTRFFIKLLTCLHYLLIAFWAILEKGEGGSQAWIVIGLVLCFMGDLALGLKHRSRFYLIVGVIAFGAGLLTYALGFGLRIEAFWLFLPILIGMSLFVLRVRMNPDYDFKGLGKAALGYGLVMGIMVACALAAWVHEPNGLCLIRMAGALCLFGSDFILLHLYFYRDKKTGFVLGYLILYHVGQSLFALSLWI